MEDAPKEDRNHLVWLIAILIPIISTSLGLWLAYSSAVATIEMANACYNRDCTIFGWMELFLTPRDLWWYCKFCVQGVKIIYAVAKEWIMGA